jgi:hypothetical protein
LDRFKFFFYSNDGDPREPPHIHVTKGGSKAKFWLRPVALASNFGFDCQDVARVGGDG